MKQNKYKTIFEELCIYLQDLKYSKDDIKTVFRDFILADKLDKPYIGSAIATKIISFQKKQKRKFLQLHKDGNLLTIDAKGEFLALIMDRYFTEAMSCATKNNAVFFSVQHAKTTPLPAVYSYLATCHNLIAFGYSFLSSNTVVFPVTNKPLLGTNPFSIALPLENGQAFVLDSAVSDVAYAKAISSSTHLGVAKNGKPTTDPTKIKHLLPFGGIKGFNFGILGLLFAGSFDNSYFQKNRYEKTREANFTYLLINSPALVEALQINGGKVLRKVMHDTDSNYRIPGEKYKEALQKTEEILLNF